MFTIFIDLFVLLAVFWVVRTVKAVLFWVYLWQLKEYHIGRFLAHFKTAKGKKLLLNKLFYIKIALLLIFLFSSAILFFVPGLTNIPILFPLTLLLLYFAESSKTAKDFFQKKIKKPLLTKKTSLILSVAFILFILIPVFLRQQIQQTEIIFDSPPLYRFCFWLLLIDILTPLIVSLIVLLFQPITVFWRNKIIKQAKEKRAKFSSVARQGASYGGSTEAFGEGGKELLVIGITGSYGKTSTKEFLYTILTEKFGENKVLKTREHQNSEVGISQCILNDLKPEHQIFICEMGAYNRGGIKLLCDIAKPKIGILTGINEQHMATFGSQENIIKTKFELIESLPEEGIGILNGDNNLITQNSIRQLADKISNLQLKSQIFYSTKEKMDIWAEDIKMYKEGISFKIFTRDGDSADFNVNLLGKQNVENILAATCAGKELGMTLKEISKACEKIKPMPGAMNLIKTKGGLNVIDTTYSANPDGTISHLDYLRLWEGKKIIVMPCLIELGAASKEVHRRIGERIGTICDLAIITTKECFENIKNAAMEGGIKKENILFIENSKVILGKIKEFCEVGDTVLLESRVPKELIGEILKTG